MEIRFVSPNDIDRVKEIWKYCFGDTDDFMDMYFSEKYSPYNTLGVYHSDNLMSTLQLLPYKMNLRGQIIDISYIVGVATMPEFRGTGCAKKLIHHALEELKRRGQLITLLLPFNYKFYQKYGWENCYLHKKYELKMQDIAHLAIYNNTILPVNVLSDIPLLLDAYLDFTSNKNGYIIRTAHDMACIINDHALEGGKCYIFKTAQGKCNGYILYSISEKIIKVHELIYANIDVLKNFISFLYSHSAQADYIHLSAASDDLLFLLLNDPYKPVKLSNFTMLRVVDVLESLAMFSTDQNISSPFTMQILDSFAQWNNVTITINAEGIKETPNKFPDIICPIGTFTQLLSGYISAYDAQKLNLLTSNSSCAMDSLNAFFSPTNNYMNDYY